MLKTELSHSLGQDRTFDARENLRVERQPVWLFLIASRHRDVLRQTVVRGKHAMEAGEVDPRLLYQGGQAGLGKKRPHPPVSPLHTGPQVA